MRTIAIFSAAAVIAALLTAPAFSQRRETGDNANTMMDRSEAAQQRAAQKRREQQELDKAYKSSLQNVGSGAPAKIDPWANARTPTEPSKK